MASIYATHLLLVFLCFMNIEAASRRSNKFVSDGSDFVIGDRWTGRPARSERENNSGGSKVCVSIEYNSTTAERNRYKNILMDELKRGGLFYNGWNRAKMIWKTEKRNKNKDPLSEEEALSVTTYTLEYPAVYREFNKQTRKLSEGAMKYQEFQFKAMHYFLHMAVDKLSAKSWSPALQIYRGVNHDYPDAVEGKSFTFKSFASTSLGRSKALGFGITTLFIIENTSKGAAISKYSKFPEEEEVLIPPCEHFIVKKKTSNNGVTEIHLIAASAVACVAAPCATQATSAANVQNELHFILVIFVASFTKEFQF